MTMNMTDQLAAEFRISQSLMAPITEEAWHLLRKMQKRTGMPAYAVIETALKGYSRAWKESE
jgi:hypothetical protein